MTKLIFCLLLLTAFSFMRDQFDNLQVLEFESKNSLNKYMKSVSKDLGVKCNYCHDLNDKSIDTDHKIIARQMMKMQNDLNKQYFTYIGDSLMKRENTLRISCWTCHRGSKEPELIRQ